MDFKNYKAEVYKYLQAQIQQVTSAYGPKFKTLFQFMDTVDEKFKSLGDMNTGIDLSFEEFKNNHSLKTNVLQDG